MPQKRAVDWEFEDLVKRELEAGERVLWMEHPVARYFTPASRASFLFAIPWTAFSIFWICGAAGFKLPDFSKGGAVLFPLFGLPFLLIGLGMLSSPIWTYRRARRTVYVITNRRAISFAAGRRMTIRSFAPDELYDVYRTEKRDGSGDVIFGGASHAGEEPVQGFYNVRDARTVEQMLKALAETARTASG